MTRPGGFPSAESGPRGSRTGVDRRRGAVPSGLLLVLFLGLLVVFFGALAKKWALVSAPRDWVLTETGSSGSEPGRGGRMNFLVMGIDSVEGTHRTDTMFLLGVDPAGKKVAIMSIPRDTRVVINGTGRKINEVMARYGEYVLRSMIENLMEIRINRAVKIDFQGFVRVIDLMGGVDVDIEHPMHYDDNWGKLHIHFDKGPAHLDGQKALEYVRFRGDPSADLGRIKRQQRFLAAVVNKLQTPAMVVRLPGIIAEALGHVETDLSLAEALDLGKALHGGGISLQTMSLPGEARYVDKISFFLPYKDEALRIGAKHYSNLLVMELDAAFSVPPTPAASPPAGPVASGPEPLSASGPGSPP
ncbi:MAG: LCP family protein [Candidatus Riflebacteria bacterium]|nr:LCP family protein [Candidatus Riflebacteria bacterium]